MQLPKMRYGTGPGREAVCNIALAYVGAIEIEVFEPLEGDVQLYRDYLPADGAFAVRHHHLSRLFDNREALERQIAAYSSAGSRRTDRRLLGGRRRALFLRGLSSRARPLHGRDSLRARRTGLPGVYPALLTRAPRCR
jgi:hypothetical protein